MTTDDASPRTRFGLLLVERSTRSESRWITIDVHDAPAIYAALDIDPGSLRSNQRFELDADEVAWCNATYGLSISFDEFHVFLGNALESDAPYVLHTGRELRLMLDGVKPMAVFSEFCPQPPNPWVFPEDVFAPHVLSGLLVRRDYCELLPKVPHESVKGARVLIYARAAEAWRIDAYITMRMASIRSGWNEGFERMEGALLGYEEWQTDDHLRRRGAWWGRLRETEAKRERG
jgi:hypothetical protein